MAKRIKLVMHKQGFADLRNSPGVLADLTERAELIAAEAELRGNGAEFEARAARPGSSFSRRSRGRSSVGTTDIDPGRNRRRTTFSRPHSTPVGGDVWSRLRGPTRRRH